MRCSTPALPVDLFGGKHRTLATHPLRAVDAHHHAPKARADGTTHVLLHAHLQPRAPASLPRPARRSFRAFATARAEAGNAEARLTAGGKARECREHRLWPARE